MSKVISPPETSTNAFARLALPLTFALDLSALESAYLTASANWHPDQHPRASSREKLALTLKTADINDAYELLKDPLRRGYHLLTLLAPELEADAEKTIKDPALLLEAMNDQEELDRMTSLSDLDLFLEKTTKQSHQTLDTITKAFSSQDYQAALHALYRYRYERKVHRDAIKKRTQLSSL